MIIFPENLPIWDNEDANAGFIIADFDINDHYGLVFNASNGQLHRVLKSDDTTQCLAYSKSNESFYWLRSYTTYREQFIRITGTMIEGGNAIFIDELLSQNDIDYRAVPAEP